MTGAEKPSGLLIVGSVAFDTIDAPSGSVERALGGSAVFASIAASYFAPARIVAVVGEDFTREHFAVLERRGIDAGGIRRVAGGRTFHWRGRYHDNMQDRDTLSTELNVFEGFDPVLPPAYRRSSDIFLGNIDPKLQAKVLDQVGAPRFIGMDTMNFWITSAPADLERVLGRVDVLFINDEESRQLTGERQVVNAAKAIIEKGPRYVVIKRGEHGALLFAADFCLFVPAVPLPRVMDPTGAGDSFAGGFMGYVAGAPAIDRGTLARALRAGSAMASFSVEQFSVGGLVKLDRAAIETRVALLDAMCAPG
jgi:sugar/nucleoside kinase (ribokinase family)